jgi:4-hydroxy-tetrahydrodipicolinate synthase
MSGEDGTALGYNAQGGVGCISVTANVAPRLVGEFQDAMAAGDYAGALKLQDRLMPLHAALFVENSPAPTKYALSLLNKCSEHVRLPLGPLSDAGKKAVREAMVHAGLLNA